MSTNYKIPLVIIEVPNGGRSATLIEQLKYSSLFDVIIFKAIMYSDKQKILYAPNVNKQKLVYGRYLSFGEIGSTISHDLVYKELIKFKSACIILEDDARIPNIKNFETQVTQFLSKYSKESSILSFLPWNHKNLVLDKLVSNHRFFKLFGHTPLSVANLITEKALVDLAVSNEDYAYLPDWPPIKSKFYTSIVGTVLHGDSKTYSVIDITGRSLTRKYFFKFTFFPYLSSPHSFSGISEYIRTCISPFYKWRIDNLRIKFYFFLLNYNLLKNIDINLK